MKKKTFWRGVEGVKMIDHGDWSDPELRYKRMVANYYDVEDGLRVLFEDDERIEGDWTDKNEKDFSLWCQLNREEVIEHIAMAQDIESRHSATFEMWDRITESLTVDEYNYVWATLRYKKCKLSEIEDFEQRIQQVIDKFTKEEEMEWDWWKVDYSEHHTDSRQYFGGANIISIEDLFLAMEDGF